MGKKSEKMNKLVQISPSIKLYRSSTHTVYVRLPAIIKEVHGITTENAKQFKAKYFRDKETDEIVIRIEKLPESKE